jgi:hypothetical protein
MLVRKVVQKYKQRELKYVSSHQSAGQTHDTPLDNKLVEIMTEYRYLEELVTNQNFNLKKLKAD